MTSHLGSQNKEQHHEIVVWVLDILHKHHLYLKVEKVHLRAAHSRIPRPHPLRRTCRDGPSQGLWCLRLANPPECDQSPVIHRVCQLLPMFTPRLLTCHQTTPSTHQEGRRVAIGQWRTEGIWRTQMPYNVHSNPKSSWTKRHHSIETDTSGYATGRFVPIRWLWQMASGRLYFQRAGLSWEELWSPWQRTSISHLRSWGMETCSRRLSIW